MVEYKSSSKSVESVLAAAWWQPGKPNPNPERVPVPRRLVALSLMEKVQCNQPATWQLAPPPESLTALSGTACHSVDQVRVLGVWHFSHSFTLRIQSASRYYCFCFLNGPQIWFLLNHLHLCHSNPSHCCLTQTTAIASQLVSLLLIFLVCKLFSTQQWLKIFLNCDKIHITKFLPF